MNPLTIIILIFSIIGGIDYLIGNKFGVGKEFARAFSLFAPMTLSMLGMIVIAPIIGVWLMPFFNGFYNHKITEVIYHIGAKTLHIN